MHLRRLRPAGTCRPRAALGREKFAATIQFLCQGEGFSRERYTADRGGAQRARECGDALHSAEIRGMGALRLLGNRIAGEHIRAGATARWLCTTKLGPDQANPIHESGIKVGAKWG